MSLAIKPKYLLSDKEENYKYIGEILKREEESLLSKKVKTCIFNRMKKVKTLKEHDTLELIADNFFLEYNRIYTDYADSDNLVYNEEYKYKVNCDLLANKKSAFETNLVDIVIDEKGLDSSIKLMAINLSYNPYDPFIDFLSEYGYAVIKFNKNNLTWKYSKINRIKTEDFIKLLTNV